MLIAAIGVAAGVVLAAWLWFSYRLILQNGRISLRLETLEKAYQIPDGGNGPLQQRLNVGPAVLPELVWNKGIAALCDWRIPDEFPHSLRYVPDLTHAGANLELQSPENLIANPNHYSAIRPGDLVWVRLAWLKSFITQVLPLTNARFVLATGDSDNSVPSHIAPHAAALLAHPNLICWFAQNCDAPSIDGRLSPLPIGIDFHTVSGWPFWGQPITSPVRQEEQLKVIASGLPPVEQRIPQVYVDFAWGPVEYGGRASLIRSISSNECFFLQDRKLSRTEMWKQRGRFAFVLCPHGHGLDCHRTWEALALGHIALVPRSPLDRVFEGLAVVSVDDWSAITPANLSRWLESHGPLTRSNDVLTSRWWVQKMRDAAQRYTEVH